MTTCIHHPSLNSEHRSHSSQDWQYDGCQVAMERLIWVAGSISKETGTQLTHPLMMEQFFGNATCSLIYGRRCSVTNNNTSSTPKTLIIPIQTTAIYTTLYATRS